MCPDLVDWTLNRKAITGLFTYYSVLFHSSCTHTHANTHTRAHAHTHTHTHTHTTTRALLEAQEIFGFDFDDPNEFARVAEEGLGSEEEEEEEDDVSYYTPRYTNVGSPGRTDSGLVVSSGSNCFCVHYFPEILSVLYIHKLTGPLYSSQNPLLHIRCLLCLCVYACFDCLPSQPSLSLCPST